MTVEALSDVAVPPAGRRATGLAILGDSSAVGLGDLLPDGSWRGFGPLLAAALGSPGEVRYTNLSFTGARMVSLRQKQLPSALRARPDVAVILAGMNDTLRPDFNPVSVRNDLEATITALQEGGAVVLATRFHEHARVFRLPGPLRRALHQRVAELNDATQQAVQRTGALCLDLDVMPGVYDTAAWSVDRLHPSELGHRMLAKGYAELLVGAGIEVPNPVELTCSGGRRITAAHHVAWLVLRGVPWLGQRGREFLPYAATLMLRDLFGGPTEVPSRGVR